MTRNARFGYFWMDRKMCFLWGTCISRFVTIYSPLCYLHTCLGVFISISLIKNLCQFNISFYLSPLKWLQYNLPNVCDSFFCHARQIEAGYKWHVMFCGRREIFTKCCKCIRRTLVALRYKKKVSVKYMLLRFIYRLVGLIYAV